MAMLSVSVILACCQWSKLTKYSRQYHNSIHYS